MAANGDSGRVSVNLDSIQFDEKLLRDKILDHVPDLDIYRHYIGHDDFIRCKAIQSPLRRDSIPSFSVFWASRAGKHMWKDWGNDTKGDVFKLVQLMYGLSFPHAIEKIAMDFGLIPGVSEAIKVRSKSMPRLIRDETVEIKVKRRPPEDYDVAFWAQFGITPEILQRYKVSAIKYFFINGHIFETEKYAYCYLEYKDGQPTYKIYQPYSKEQKFVNNNDYSVWEGWTQLPQSGDLLLITSGRKDVMSIVATTGIPAIALQSESILPKAHVVDQLRARFKRIVIFYDNDQHSKENHGRKYGIRLSEEFGFERIEIPTEYDSKDYSDLVRDHGAATASQVLHQLLGHEQPATDNDPPF